MTRLRTVLAAALLLTAACSRRGTLPMSLGDAEFRELMETLSEPPGTFALSDNLVSNEPRVAENARWLRPSGGAYIGVGPEQNFTYIARARPDIAFVIDIRRENRNLHLLYKALFEMSRDRADFLSQLFARLRPAALSSRADVNTLFAAFDRVAASPALYVQTVAMVHSRLLDEHGLALSPADLRDIDRSLDAFRDAGPDITFWGSHAVVDPRTLRPSYRSLMTMVDLTGQRRSFLSSEQAFGFVKDMQLRNLIVPVVGDFGGAGVIRRVGSYVADHRATVRTFYGSNVPVYLTLQQNRAFCGYLGGLPAARDAAFVDSDSVRPLAAKIDDCRHGR